MEQADLNRELHVLILEDTPTDAELMEHELRKAGIAFTSMRVETRDAFVRALEEFRPDIILSDYHLPDFNGMAALEIVRHNHPEVPVIMVTGALPDIEAVELLHAGARDYVLKDRLARLAPAVQRAISAEQGIRARKLAEAKFRKISEAAQDAIIMMADKRITFWNAAAERIFGYTAAEAMGQELHGLIAPPLAQAAFALGYTHFQESGEGPVVGKVLELNALRKGGEAFPVELSISAAQLNGQWQAISTVRDITERKRAEQALSESEKLYRSLFENMLNGFAYCRMIFEQDDPQDFIYLNVNAAFETLTGLKNVSGKKVSEVIPGIRQSDPQLFEIYGRVSLSGISERFETYVKALHQWFWVSVYSAEKGYFIAVFDDITERKRAELTLQHTNRTLRTLSAGNSALIHANDEPQLLQAMCRIAVEKGGYRMAWVGYLEQGVERSIRVVAQAGFEEGYLEQAHITWADNEHGQGPTGRTARNGQTEVAQNIALDPNMSPWRLEAAKHGYASSIALPLLEHDQCFGVLTIYAAEPDAFDNDEIKLLEEMAGDLAFGILTLRVRVAHREHEQRLLKSMLQTVQAIAGIVEMRDPYTSGHQVRVAEIARAIAGQMDMSEEQMQVIYLAGLVHDLGKISIPSEILSKPARLNTIEYSLIKMHPQAGYDILKGIDFSWPIALIVLQHHERMDGSGYPQGLKGEEILPGARILAVADVVEAMSSHRPYRPGLGIDAALEEIIRARGTHYDAQVVDACVALFKEQRYVLPK